MIQIDFVYNKQIELLYKLFVNCMETYRRKLSGKLLITHNVSINIEYSIVWFHFVQNQK